MWSFASNASSGSTRMKNDSPRPGQALAEYLDDDISFHNSREEGLECPICWESFNLVENVTYVLWCGHTLCKNCILGLQCAVVKFPTLPILLPFFISCPWCKLLPFRLVYRSNLRFPRKNFFILWMVERMNVDRVMPHSSICRDHQLGCSSSRNLPTSSLFTPSNCCHGSHVHPSEQVESNRNGGHFVNVERLQLSLHKSFLFLCQLTSKFPLVILFLLIVMYLIPFSAAILVLYIFITILFAIPSLLILYFAYPSLDWLVREILT